MKSYLVIGYLLLLPLFAISMAARELVEGMSQDKSSQKLVASTMHRAHQLKVED